MVVGLLLNQVHAGCRLVRAWFLKIVSEQMSVGVFVYVCVCPPPRLLIISGVMWTPYDWLNKYYTFIWQLKSLSVVGVVLELKRVVVTNPTRVSQCCISHYITV